VISALFLTQTDFESCFRERKPPGGTIQLPGTSENASSLFRPAISLQGIFIGSWDTEGSVNMSKPTNKQEALEIIELTSESLDQLTRAFDLISEVCTSLNEEAAEEDLELPDGEQEPRQLVIH
jgi:hypothetical protein